MEKIVVIGAGSWGCALSRILADNGHNIMIYDVDKNTVDEINLHHTNKSKLHEAVLPENIVATSSLEVALQFGNIILLVVPTAVVRNVLHQINRNIKNSCLFINASKGIEPNTSKRVSEIVYEEIDNNFIEGFVALTGPSHAEEVVMQKVTVVAAASTNQLLSKKVQILFSNNTYFRVYRVDDLVGAELGGSLKNVYALAAGICDGIGYGVNARTALITRGLSEMKKLAIAMGAQEKTLNGLTGIGDLIVTCTSHLSRNYQAGVVIGRGKNLKETLDGIPMVVEGARTCISAYQAARFYNIDTPIIDAIYHVIYQDKNPIDEIKIIMSRELKEE